MRLESQEIFVVGVIDINQQELLWYICTVEYYAAVNKKELLLFATAWMDLENIMLSEISQSEKDTYHVISHICGI